MWEGRMPRLAVTSEAQRLEFRRLAVSDSGVLFVELCRRFGISAKTGYKWPNRYVDEGPGGLGDRQMGHKGWFMTATGRCHPFCGSPHWSSRSAPMGLWRTGPTLGVRRRKECITVLSSGSTPCFTRRTNDAREIVELAPSLHRRFNKMYRGKKVSVVLPTYNERDSIREVIESFERTGVVDEIIVVNNNAAAGTSEEIAPTTAVEIQEPKQGYGSAIRRGFRESTGEFVCVCEPDGTFDADDIHKLLAYSRDVDIVYGSRTVGEFIWFGANMGFLIRFGNWSVAKLMEVLFNTNSLSDVGCTFRMARREALDLLEPHFTIDGSSFGPEMMCLSILAGLRIVQIPVNYRERVGRSSVTGDLKVTVKLGLRMVGLILYYRIRSTPIRARMRSTSARSIG